MTEGKFYPRKVRVGWCVAHEVTAAGITIERYGVKCRTYDEAYRRAHEMNLEHDKKSLAKESP